MILTRQERVNNWMLPFAVGWDDGEILVYRRWSVKVKGEKKF